MKEIIIRKLFELTKINKNKISQLIEIPPLPELGDYAFPCFVLANELKKNPLEIADNLAKKIHSSEFEKVEAKGPYLNFFINRNKLAEKTLKSILKEKDSYGSSKIGKGKTIIEFSQPNTHKAFHIGHVRGTSLGESLSRIFEFQGVKVFRVNYSGDTGMHIAKWIWCYQRYHKNEKLKNDESWIAEIYVDAIKRLSESENFQEEVEEINRKIESKEDKKINEIWRQTRKLSIDSWKKIYQQLNTGFDKHYFESEVESSGKEIAEDLLKKGIAKKSDGATIIDLQNFNLGIWVLLRKDGTVLYSAKDLALAKKKKKDFQADSYLVIVGDEQRLHFQQLIKTLELMGENKEKNYNFLTYALVRLPTGKMSSRTGENILYSGFISELKNNLKNEIKKREKSISGKDLEKRSLKLAIASMKYPMLKQDSNKVIVFDKSEALSFEGNTGPYLLYTYARAKSILRKSENKGTKSFKIESFSDSEKNLMLNLGKFSEITQQAYQNLAPNLIANYSFQISQAFNEFYHSSQVIGSESENFRISLVRAFSQVLKNSLNLLGIEVLEKM